jgi:hypothetical protein
MAHDVMTGVMGAVMNNARMINMMTSVVMTSVIKGVMMMGVMRGVVMTCMMISAVMKNEMIGVMIGAMMTDVIVIVHPLPMFDVTCHICKIHGHSASDCWWRNQDNSDDDDHNDKVVHAAAYGIDTNWYTNTRAIDHITRALNKMAIHDKYQGHDCVHTADGNGMSISHIVH